MGNDRPINKPSGARDDAGKQSGYAVAACARSLADDASLQIPEPASAILSVAISRGASDAVALRQAHHDPAVHRQFMPADPLGKRLYGLIERERYEALGANRFTGVGRNLDACWQYAADTPEDSAHEAARADDAIERDVAVLCRNAFRLDAAESVRQLSPSVETAYTELLDTKVFDRLTERVQDQAGFSALASTLATDIAMRMTAASALDSNAPVSADAELDDSDDEDASGVDEEAAELDDSAPVDEPDSDADESAAEGQGDSEAADELPDNAIDEAPIAGPDPTIVISGDTQPYRAYTTDFDEIEVASRWADTEQLAQWREELDQHIELHGRLVRRLAARLQRVLLARQKRHWQFDLEEGQLDTARLSRIISDPLMPLSFKAESETAFRNTTITLLIDNSRSMLGRPIMIAAACADILARTLERCGVSVEILGFTTVHLHGGSSTERWEQQGKPDNPGRLNDLRHIVYKSADTPYRNARRNLGLMLDKDILKQNIDGEALMWAYKRLMKRPEERRILMTISDGAPVDTSTLGANAGDYLARHLQLVVDEIEGAESVELMAIGIGHDVSRFYSQAVSVFDARQLGPVMLDKLETLFRQAA